MKISPRARIMARSDTTGDSFNAGLTITRDKKAIYCLRPASSLSLSLSLYLMLFRSLATALRHNASARSGG